MITRCFFGTGCLILSLTAGGWISAMDDPGIAMKPIFADLDRDGKSEQISWVKFASTEEEGDFFQVQVMDDDGSLIWEGPKVKDAQNPFAFGAWHFGISIPEIAADIDGDGSVEMVTPAPQSDVSPTYFRVLRWTGGRFVEAESGCLLESGAGSGRFPWQKTEQWQGTWISSFKEARPGGLLRVEVLEYRGGAEAKVGEALVNAVPGGFQVNQWTRPLAPEGNGPAGGEFGEAAMPPQDGGAAVVYRARLGPGDHFNSRGERLTAVMEVIRQDRANFYKGTRDGDDESDPVFGSRAARDAMEGRQLIPVGSDEASWSRTILNGSPLVEVEVAPDAFRIRILEP